MKSFVPAAAIVLAATTFALADPPAKTPTAKAAACAEKLKARVGTFELWLKYVGPQDKPYYGLHLVNAKRLAAGHASPAPESVGITEEEIKKIIDYLAVDGFLDRAPAKAQPKPSEGPSYRLKIMTNLGPDGTLVRGVWSMSEDLGWGLPMLKRLDGLRSVLTGDAAKQMDQLLQRLSGHRKEWEESAARAGAEPKQ